MAELSRAYATRSVVLQGRAGLANVMKLCVNYTAISMIELMGEVYAFAEKAGLDGALLREFFTGAFNRPAFKMYAAKLHDQDISGDGGFAMSTGLKDVRLMLDAAAARGVRFELGEIVQRKMHKALDMGLAAADWSAIAQVTRAESGLTSSAAAATTTTTTTTHA